MKLENDLSGKDISRAGFIAWLVGLLALFSAFFISRRKRIAGSILGPDFARGHSLRSPVGHLAQNATDQKIDTLIVGGGISGLSAAWYLQKNGFTDFQLLELENQTGGNARWGENRFTKFPWGAHYLPTPGANAVYVKELLVEMGVLKNGVYSSEVLCHEVEERLFLMGHWQQGLIPHFGARSGDRDIFQRFSDLMQSWRHKKGRDGRVAFSIPLDLSSQDETITQLDQISFAQYLSQNQLQSARLNWYIDYICRDEYGTNRNNTSAWAGIHYFAARSESHNLIWPEGNGFIAEYLRRKVAFQIRPDHAVRSITKVRNDFEVLVQNMQSNELVKYRSKRVIYAAPKFLLPHAYANLDSKISNALHDFHYSPWMTANCLVRDFATENPAWDNVFYGSDTLGYVVAEHQKIALLPHYRTLTWFKAFDADDTLASRRFLKGLAHKDAVQMVVSDLARAHPKIESQIEQMDFFYWAHAMIRPRPGFIHGASRKQVRQIEKNFFCAHSDMSGMSNFEEAQYQGINAARQILS